MSLRLTEEQREFQSSLSKFFSDQISSEYRRARSEAAQSLDENLLRGVEELGLYAIFSETDPELACGFRELSLIAFEEGKALVPQRIAEPLLSGPFLFSRVLNEADTAALGLTSDDVHLIREGGARVGVIPPEGALELSKETKPEVLSGRIHFAEAADRCEYFICSTGSGTWSFFRNDKNKLGIEAEPSLDLTLKHFTLEPHELPARLFSPQISETFSDMLLLNRAVEMAGVCSRVVNMTSEYVKTRKQFGVPVGGFQAVQHQLVDMYVKSEALRALTSFACWAFDHSREQFHFAALSAGLATLETASYVVEKAIQLHGGIGFTWEYDLHLYLRRARTFSATFRFDEVQHRQLIEAVR